MYTYAFHCSTRMCVTCTSPHVDILVDGHCRLSCCTHVYIFQSVLMVTVSPSEPLTGVMIPIPQYPLYSATASEFGLHPVSSHRH